MNTNTKMLLIGFDALTARLMTQYENACCLAPSVESIRREFLGRLPSGYPDGIQTACLAPDPRIYCPTAIGSITPDAVFPLDKLLGQDNLAGETASFLIAPFIRMDSCRRLLVFCPQPALLGCPRSDLGVPMNQPLGDEVRQQVGYEIFRSIFRGTDPTGTEILPHHPLLDGMQLSPNRSNESLYMLSAAGQDTAPLSILSGCQLQSPTTYGYGNSTGGMYNAVVIRGTSPSGIEKEIIILPTPSDLGEIHAILQHLLRDEPESVSEIKEIIESKIGTEISMRGNAPVLLPLFRQLLMAGMNVGRHVLLLGETGTGKELAADMIRCLATGKKAGSLTTVHCPLFVGADFRRVSAALFGCAKNAYTGADKETNGFIHDARRNGGCLFLDEIQALPMETMQVLFRFMETGQYCKVGDTTPNTLRGVRIIGASNRIGMGMSDKWEKSGFMSRFEHIVTLPPLRYRVGDIPELAHHFYGAAIKTRKVPALDEERLRALIEEAIKAWKKDEWRNSNVGGLKMAVASWIDRKILEIDLERLSTDPKSARRKKGRAEILSDKALRSLITNAKTWIDVQRGYTKATSKNLSSDRKLYAAIRAQIYRKREYDLGTRRKLLKELKLRWRTLPTSKSPGRPRVRRRGEGDVPPIAPAVPS